MSEDTPDLAHGDFERLIGDLMASPNGPLPACPTCSKTPENVLLTHVEQSQFPARAPATTKWTTAVFMPCQHEIVSGRVTS
ncbi:hypothetical protein ABIA35_009835 [Catenulispora sp. MAP12-49]|uniref:hypothetical protein n=1 Tax=unclassified Catenulispora TaxID=414885 RepID=UPI003517B525